MKILGIETSCDDTGIAVLEVLNNKEIKILSNLVASQIEVHKKYGGVFPAMAKREHQKNLVPTFIASLKAAQMLSGRASPQKGGKLNIVSKILERELELKKQLTNFFRKYEKPDLDAIAVTNGPGLEPCLWVGVNFAKALSYIWNIPVIPVNHIEGHILVNLLENPDIKFPAIALVVSGGHTQLVLMPRLGEYKIIGETRDDAAGECFDKCAKILGLGYPGGPIISALAENPSTGSGQAKITLPRPMINTKDYDFSFSGLKTAVLYADRKVKNKNKEYKKQMAAEVQQAIIDVLLKKTLKAIKDFSAKSLILGGGVTANKELKTQFEKKLEKENPGIKLIAPKPNLSADNALMVAITGFHHRDKKVNWKTLKADSNLRVE